MYDFKSNGPILSSLFYVFLANLKKHFKP